MRGLGEIDRLAEIAAPTIGVITNIGYAHIERWVRGRASRRPKRNCCARLPANGDRGAAMAVGVLRAYPAGVACRRQAAASLCAGSEAPFRGGGDGRLHPAPRIAGAGPHAGSDRGRRSTPLPLQAVGPHH